MRAYRNKCEAVIGLHERGFTGDFELCGDRFAEILQQVLVIYSVVSDCYSAKGILLNYHKNFSDTASAIGYKLLKPGSNLVSYSCNYENQPSLQSINGV